MDRRDNNVPVIRIAYADLPEPVRHAIEEITGSPAALEPVSDGLNSAVEAAGDHVVRVRRSFELGPQGKVGLLRDRPVYVAVSSGGRPP